jgi:hypothetical protein
MADEKQQATAEAGVKAQRVGATLGAMIAFFLVIAAIAVILVWAL